MRRTDEDGPGYPFYRRFADYRKTGFGISHRRSFAHEMAGTDASISHLKNILKLTASIFDKYKAFVYMAPSGVFVLAIAPHVKSKYYDLAIRVANIISAEQVVTTTTEVLKSLIVGISCRWGAKSEIIMEAVNEALSRIKAKSGAVRFLASVDIKANEDGLREAADRMGIPLRLIHSHAIKEVKRYLTDRNLHKRKLAYQR